MKVAVFHLFYLSLLVRRSVQFLRGNIIIGFQFIPDSRMLFKFQHEYLQEVQYANYIHILELPRQKVNIASSSFFFPHRNGYLWLCPFLPFTLIGNSFHKSQLMKVSNHKNIYLITRFGYLSFLH